MVRQTRAGTAPTLGPKGGAWRLIFGLFSILFVAGGLYFGWVFVSHLGEIVDALGLQALGISPGIASQTEDAPNWAIGERVNVLVMGLDQRPGQVDSPMNTDTMLVATIDPSSKSAGVLSIPRDLWVPIPLREGQSPLVDRINTAYANGEVLGYPGGGPALAKKTVQYNLGVRIHYYIVLDFDGFKRIVDTLDGIDVTLDKPLVDYEYPTDDYYTTTIYIPAGHQHLNGEKALWYVRSRHQEGDFGRIQRQQRAILAIRDKALRLDVVPRLPQLWGEFKDAIKTDLTLSEVMRLARLAQEVKPESITTASIDENYVVPTMTANGAAVLLPQRKAIAGLVRQVFFDARLEQEQATVEVLNGTARPGLAASTATFLQSHGFKSVTYGTTDLGQNPAYTTIIDYTGKKYVVELIASLLKVPNDRIQEKRDPRSTVDIRVVLGQDATALAPS